MLEEFNKLKTQNSAELKVTSQTLSNNLPHKKTISKSAQCFQKRLSAGVNAEGGH